MRVRDIVLALRVLEVLYGHAGNSAKCIFCKSRRTVHYTLRWTEKVLSSWHINMGSRRPGRIHIMFVWPRDALDSFLIVRKPTTCVQEISDLSFGHLGADS